MGPKKRPTRGGRKAKVRESAATNGRKRATPVRQALDQNAAKLARLRDHEPVDVSSHPANSFITLTVLPTALSALNLPVYEGRWKHIFHAQNTKETAATNKADLLDTQTSLFAEDTSTTGRALRSRFRQGVVDGLATKRSETVKPIVANSSLAGTLSRYCGEPSSALHIGSVEAFAQVLPATAGSLQTACVTQETSLEEQQTIQARRSVRNSAPTATTTAQSKQQLPIIGGHSSNSQVPVGSRNNLLRNTPDLPCNTTQTSRESVLRHINSPAASLLQKVASQSTATTESYLLEDKMAPVRDPNSVPGSIKDVIQNLFEVQTQVHGFVPETQPLLIDKMTELAQSLAHLQDITSPTISPDNPIQQTRIAPEIIDYVDDGRNPDIFTRDFVELVQRGNAVINGKQQAFRDFSQIFANALKEGIPGIGPDVDSIMKNVQDNSVTEQAPQNRENGASRP